MSHYRVAVFARNPGDFEELLAPYSENDDTYFEFVPSTRSEEELKRMFENRHHEDTDYEEWLKDLGYVRENGVLGYYANPNAKWDWYSLDGGAWQFDFKKGEKYDANGNARKNQFNYISHDYNEASTIDTYNRIKKRAETSSDQAEKEDAISFLKEFPTVTQYILREKWEHPYAFVTPDGIWHAPGVVGWFGSSDDTPESYCQYIEEWIQYVTSSEDPYVNFVDCHI